MNRSWHGIFELPENHSALAAAKRALTPFLKQRKPIATPLFFHGLPGTGKSHLLQAMMNEVTAHPSGQSVQLLPAGEIPGMTADEATEEIKQLETVDLLMLEDMQHFPRKKSQTLCRLLDHRLERHRLTVFTSTVGPALLSRLPRRLTSRLSAGLVVQLEPIGKDSRRLVVAAQAQALGLKLTAEAVDELTRRTFGGGLRPVLGLLSRVKILVRGKADALSAEHLIEILKEQESLSTISPLERILWQTANHYGVKAVEVLGSSRRKDLVTARQAAIYLARELTDFSLPQLGQFFGGRDHTTILHAHRKVTNNMATDRKLARMMADLKAELE